MSELLKHEMNVTVGEEVQLVQANDGSYLVAFVSVLGKMPDAVLGCIAPAINTEDIQSAVSAFYWMLGLRKKLDANASVSECDQLKRTFWEICYGPCH